MRFLFVALFMALATHVSAQETQGVTAEAPSQQESKGGKANDTQPSANEPSIPVRIIESPEETQRTRDREATSDKHESDDLKAQQEAAQAAGRSATAADRQVNAAWWQVGVGIAGIIAILVTIGFTIRATNAAVRSADLAEKAIADAREMGEAQTRAYLGVSSVEARIEMISVLGDAPASFLTIKVNVINGGVTPARNVVCIGGITTIVKKTETVIASETKARNEDFLPSKEYCALGHSVEFGDEELARFKRRDFVIGVHGRITYDPVVGGKGRFVDYQYVVTAYRTQDPLQIERVKTASD
ncbi:MULTISPECIES: hypothetical protein [unclassified Mesorhizobium]|uniref:hypothetical protein n=1 Tax=unclassified Mesorhizobium TaxID=325217 RepID=UPI0012EB306D|nr:hypothetical protein [Mesorhizobium sp. LSJC268A00]